MDNLLTPWDRAIWIRKKMYNNCEKPKISIIFKDHFRVETTVKVALADPTQISTLYTKVLIFNELLIISLAILLNISALSITN